MPTVRANDLDIGYEVEGAGPPLILLHGATSSGREDFAAQVPLLGQAFRCFLPDARGHATTRWDAADGFGRDWLVDDLAAFADAARLDTFHLLGFSMGGATALAFAIQHPARLRTLVLVGTSPRHEPRTSVARRLFDPRRIDAQDPAWAAELGRRHDPVQGPDAWRRLLPAIAADVSAQREPTAIELRGVDAPALVVVGDRDPFVPVDQAWALRRQFPDARLLVVPDSGHDVPWRRPALFNVALAGFYRSTAGTAAARAVAAGGRLPRATDRRVGDWSSSRGEPAPEALPDADWLGSGGRAAPAAARDSIDERTEAER